MKNCILKPSLFIFALLLSVLIFSSCNNGESNVILTDDNTDNTTALDSECTNDSYTTDSDSTVDELTTEEETYAYEDGIDRILSTEGLCELSSNKNLIVFDNINQEIFRTLFHLRNAKLSHINLQKMLNHVII